MNGERENIDGDKMRRMEDALRRLGAVLDDGLEKIMGERMGFCLATFSFDGHEFSWISNAERADMIKGLEELLAKLKTGEASQTWQQRG